MTEYSIIQFTTYNIHKRPQFLLWTELKCSYYGTFGLDMTRVLWQRKHREGKEEKWMSFITSCPGSHPFDACPGWRDWWVRSSSTDATFKMTNWSLRPSTGIQDSHSQNSMNNKEVPCRCFTEKKALKHVLTEFLSFWLPHLIC